MRSAFDASVGLQSNGGSGNLSFAHVTGSPFAVLLVGVSVVDTISDVITGITYNGVAMTRVGFVALGGVWGVYLYILQNPATGSNTVLVSVSGTHTVRGRSYSTIGGSRVITQPDTSNTNSGSAISALSVSVTPVRDFSWAVVYSVNNSDAAATAAAGSTMRSADGNNNNIFCDSNAEVPARATKSLGTTWTTGGAAVAIAVAIAPHREDQGFLAA